MKYYKSIFLLLIAALFLSGVIKQNKRPKSLTEDQSSNRDSSVYEVRFTFTGTISLFENPTDSHCPSGSVIMTGLLKGVEDTTADEDEDIIYTGTLQLDIRMDICSIKETGGNPPTVPCSMTVFGSGPVKTKLKISFDGRGAYIQITDTTKTGFSKNVNGSCDPQQMIQQQKLVPIRSVASVFNGLDLPSLKDRTLLDGRRYVDTGEAGETVVEVLRKIR